MCGGLFGCCMCRSRHIRFAMPGIAFPSAARRPMRRDRAGGGEPSFAWSCGSALLALHNAGRLSNFGAQLAHPGHGERLQPAIGEQQRHYLGEIVFTRWRRKGHVLIIVFGSSVALVRAEPTLIGSPLSSVMPANDRFTRPSGSLVSREFRQPGCCRRSIRRDGNSYRLECSYACATRMA